MANKIAKLTHEEEMFRESFIAKCVVRNATLLYSAHLGQKSALVIQEIEHLNIETLRKIGKQIQTAISKHGESDFDDTQVAELRFGRIKASDWVQYLKLTIQDKNYKTAQKDQATVIEQLERELDDLKTPDQKRAELQEKLAALKGTPAVPDKEVAIPVS